MAKQTKEQLIEEREKLVNDVRAVKARTKGTMTPDDVAETQRMMTRHKEAGEELAAVIKEEGERARDDARGVEHVADIDAFLREQAEAHEQRGSNGAAPVPEVEPTTPTRERIDKRIQQAIELDFRTLNGDPKQEARVREVLERHSFEADNARHLERISKLSRADKDMLAYLQMGTQQRNIVMGTDAQGGFLVPPNTTLYGMLTEEMEAYMGVSPLMTTMMTDTLAEAPKPRSGENRRRATVIAENTDGADRTTPVFAQDKFNPRTIATDRYGVTWQAMRSAGINLQSYLARILGEQLARGVNWYFINGNASATVPEPAGLNTTLPAASETLNGIVGYKIGATQLHYGAYSASSVHHGLAKLLPAVQHGVNIAYRSGPKAAIVMSDQILLQLRTAVSDDGIRLYPELDMPTQDGAVKYGGMKLVVDPNMPDFASNGNSSKMIYVGNFARFWKLDVSGFIFIDDPYTGSLSLSHRYRLAKACDSEVIDDRAIAYVDVDAVT